MLSFSELKKGAQIIINGEPFEILESAHLKVAMRRPVIQSKIRSLISGKTIEKTFQQGDIFKEAEIEKFQAKFIYANKGKFVFSEIDNPSNRFELTEDQLGTTVNFLKPNEIVDGLKFDEKIINISPPIKVVLKVVEAPPGVKGDRAQGGTKAVKLETGTTINVPLFIETDDLIEVNTDTGEYTRRVAA